MTHDAKRVRIIPEFAPVDATIARDGQGRITSVTKRGITTVLNRDGSGTLTSIDINGEYRITLIRDGSGSITGTVVTEL